MSIEDVQLEPKGPKRIGVVQWLDPELLRSLPNFVRLFDHDYIRPEDRRAMFRNIDGLVIRETAFENITPDVGFAQITKAQTGALASLDDLLVRWHVLGTDDGTILPIGSGNTQLGAEGNRKAVTSKSRSGAKAFYTIVYAEAEAVGVWEEMGLIMGGSNAPDTGFVWDRSLYAWEKTAVQAVTFDYEDTYVNVDV